MSRTQLQHHRDNLDAASVSVGGTTKLLTAAVMREWGMDDTMLARLRHCVRAARMLEVIEEVDRRIRGHAPSTTPRCRGCACIVGLQDVNDRGGYCEACAEDGYHDVPRSPAAEAASERMDAGGPPLTPAQRFLRTGRIDPPLALLGPGGSFTRPVNNVGDLLGIGCDVRG